MAVKIKPIVAGLVAPLRCSETSPETAFAYLLVYGEFAGGLLIKLSPVAGATKCGLSPGLTLKNNVNRGSVKTMDPIGMIFGAPALYRVYKLEKVLNESGILDKYFDSEK
ncbi:MAG: hypothetical protein ACI8RN_000083 [Glaciecola sp.]|jgi:hypothetical protein|uniref:hypothetical protein n=1 Tax=Congregibacter sp. TaxID=2744308 RepID=UPI0039E487A3